MQKHSVDTIGTTERVSFPKLDARGVHAKVDTGADSSSLWASDIRESTDGKLSFAAFGPGSRFYTGSRITVKTFRRVLVKNSFGVVEPRYKVRLLLQIGDRKIRAWFTLADRTGMKYPVLLGRRLLRNKFVVDVGKKHMHAGSQPYRVLALGAPEHRVKAFFDSVAEQMTHEVEFVARSLKELAFWIEPGNTEVRETVTNRDIADFDLVYFKTHRHYYEFAIAAAEYLSFHHVAFFDEELRSYVAYDKLAETMRLALHDLPVPQTFCGSAAVLKMEADSAIARLGSPFVCKEINADRSQQNYLLVDRTELTDVLETADPQEIFMLQRYVENDGYIRALVLGSAPALVIRRSVVVSKDPRKRHLNTPAGAANAELLLGDNVPEPVHRLASWAAKVTHRQVTGVDLIQEKQTGDWFVLEVNTAPQIRSGAFPDEKRAAFAKFIDLQLDK